MKIYGSLRASVGSHANVIVKRLLDRLDGHTMLRTAPVADDATMLIQWGYKPTEALLTAIRKKIPYVIIDLGYFDPTRLERFSVSINGLHGYGMRVDGLLDLPPRPHPRIQKWREGGDRVIIVGQMPGDASLFGTDIHAWMNRAASAAVDAFGLPVVKRDHPKERNDWEPRVPPLESTFDDTYCYVTYSSTAAVQTVVAGIPTVAIHPSSAAYAMCACDVERVRFPGRELWAHALSHKEYGMLDDAECDAAAEYILRAYPCAAAQAFLGDVSTEGLRV